MPCSALTKIWIGLPVPNLMAFESRLVTTRSMRERSHRPTTEAAASIETSRVRSRLIDRIALWSAQRGAQQLTLTTYRDVPWNAPYYARLGFVECPLSSLGSAHHGVWEGQRGMGLNMDRRLVMTRAIARR